MSNPIRFVDVPQGASTTPSLASPSTSSASGGLNPQPLLAVFQRMFTDTELVRSLRKGAYVLDSSVFSNACAVAVKSAPFAFFGENAVVREFDNGLSCRMRFLETAVMSAASLVYNVAFACVFTALTLVTLGKVKMIYDQMCKHWVQAALAKAGVAVGTIGTFSPKWGIYATGAVGALTAYLVVAGMQRDAAQNVCNVYQRNARELREALSQAFPGGSMGPAQMLTPVLDYLDTNLTAANVQSISALTTVITGAPWRNVWSVLPASGNYAYNAASELVATRTASIIGWLQQR